MTEKSFASVSQDEIVLLAEGEITGADRDELFDRLDAKPEDWRKVALALMETQSLSRSFDAINVTMSNLHNDCSKKAKTNSPMTKAVFNGWATWMSAACLALIVGFAAGVGLSSFRGNSDAASVAVAKNTGRNAAEFGTDNPIVYGLTNRDPDLLRKIEHTIRSLPVADSEVIALFGQNVDGNAEIFPIIQSPSLQRQLSNVSAPQLSADVVDRLSNDGWQVNSKRHFVSFQGPHGSKQILPIGMLNYQFKGRETF